MARWLMITGALLLVAGAVFHYAPWTLSWFGRLPGDIRIDTDSGRIFIPVTSMIIISVILTVLVNLFRR